MRTYGVGMGQIFGVLPGGPYQEIRWFEGSPKTSKQGSTKRRSPFKFFKKPESSTTTEAA